MPAPTRMLTLLAITAAIGALGAAAALGSSAATTANAKPRLSALTARLGMVHVEGTGKKARGVSGTFRLCDDGPQNGPRRVGTLSVTHIWSNRSGARLVVGERSKLSTYDRFFKRPQCKARIPWSSTMPGEFALAKSYPCYSVSLQVRDPGGKSSKLVTRVVKRCR